MTLFPEPSQNQQLNNNDLLSITFNHQGGRESLITAHLEQRDSRGCHLAPVTQTIMELLALSQKPESPSRPAELIFQGCLIDANSNSNNEVYPSSVNITRNKGKIYKYMWRFNYLLPRTLTSTFSYTRDHAGTTHSFHSSWHLFLDSSLCGRKAFLFGRASYIQLLSRIQEGGD